MTRWGRVTGDFSRIFVSVKKINYQLILSIFSHAIYSAKGHLISPVTRPPQVGGRVRGTSPKPKVTSLMDDPQNFDEEFDANSRIKTPLQKSFKKFDVK